MAITLFAGVSSATGQQLDDNLTAASNQAPIPCSISGTNTITLTQKANTYTVTAYGNNMQLSGVASGTNSGAVTAQLGSLGALGVFKDSTAGPIALAGGEIVSGNAFTLLYDSALASGAGGFHLFSSTANPSSSISRYLSSTVSVSFSLMSANAAQEVLVSVSGIRPNDAVILGPPSLTAGQPVSYFGYVTATGSVLLRAVNAGAATITPSSGIFRITGIG